MKECCKGLICLHLPKLQMKCCGEITNVAVSRGDDDGDIVVLGDEWGQFQVWIICVVKDQDQTFILRSFREDPETILPYILLMVISERSGPRLEIRLNAG